MNGSEQTVYGIQALEIQHEFGKKKVLNGVTLRISKGEIFGLLGPSGAGKTTLIKILTGQLAPTGGQVITAGENGYCTGGKPGRRTENGRMRQCRIGIMMDEFGVYERLTCYENLKLFARIYGLPRHRIDSALEQVGLTDAKKRAAMHLSKGMRSRLILARALMAEPDILFLDEPVSGLDPATAEEIHRLLRVQQQRGVTIFLTTHNMSEAQNLCGNIALLHEGRIVEQGSPEEICRRYDHQRRIRLHLCDGRDVELANGASSAGEVAGYLEREMVRTIHSTEPDLESVFMELTGRGLD
ncbi:MAG: ABC transporter ATP-binding protein [Lachnospiraceae bacterium]|nr:ABC transporter ATP-binding protein [Lachnospiraceae bacterium]